MPSRSKWRPTRRRRGEAESKDWWPGYYTAVVVVMDDDLSRAERVAGEVIRELRYRGFGARLETLNANDGYLGFDSRKRRIQSAPTSNQQPQLRRFRGQRYAADGRQSTIPVPIIQPRARRSFWRSLAERLRSVSCITSPTSAHADHRPDGRG